MFNILFFYFLNIDNKINKSNEGFKSILKKINLLDNKNTSLGQLPIRTVIGWLNQYGEQLIKKTSWWYRGLTIF